MFTSHQAALALGSGFGDFDIQTVRTAFTVYRQR
jgi:hypothetical protein